MTIREFRAGFRPRPLKFRAGEVPHATLEINRTCNLRCRCCYNVDRDGLKPYDEVERDLALLMSLRRLQAVTILGGEPTLHPDLARIVSLVKGRGLHCQLLTNGLRFLDPDGPALVRSLKAAGLDKVLLHVDGGQAHVRGDIESARERLFSLMEAAGLEFSLSLTVYNEDRGRMADVVRCYARFRYFDGVLAVLARDLADPASQTVRLSEEYDGLRAGLGLEPSSYVPSDRSDEEARWLAYFYLIDAGGTAAFSLSPRADRMFRVLFRRLTGRHFFTANLGPAVLPRILGPLVLLEALASPRRLPALAGMVRRAAKTGGLRLHVIAIQTPPDLGPNGEIAVICRGCPDATIRDGRLVPVCLADLFGPFRPQLREQEARS